MSPSAPLRADGSPGSAPAPATSVRWWICVLLFFATTINYVDRNALSVLKTTLQDQLHWDDADYGWITFAFTASYAIFPSFVGRMIDKFGVKVSFAIGVVLWSIMCSGHAFARTAAGFAAARFLLGAAESTNFPASIKSVSQWFPKRERAFATGLFNSGSNVGVMVSFLAVWMAERFSWQYAFIMIGALGFVWLAFWLKFYHSPETHPSISPSELAFIQADQPPEAERARVHWTAMLRFSRIWPFLIGKFLTDPVWWFYLYWLPSYLTKERGRDPLKSALLLGLIYTGATVGSIGGGWLSGFLIGKGWRVGAARYMTMGIAAACMPGAILAYYTQSFNLCIALITLATGCHQAWSANIFTTATDLFPSRTAGSVTGLGATAGAVGGMFMALLSGMAVQWTGTQKVVFIWAGLMHPLSLIVFWLWLGVKGYRPIDVEHDIDMTKSNNGLIGAGGVLVLIGAVIATLVKLHWAEVVAAAKFAGASQGMTAGIGTALIGMVLFYAGLGQKPRAAVR